MEVKEDSEEVGLKLNIQKTKIMASGSITSWQIEGETMETVTDFILGVPKSMQMVTSAMKLKDALWKKSYDKPRQYVKKHRHYFANKICLLKAMVFPIVMNGCESWTSTEHRRIDAFELWCYRKLLRVLWISRRSNHSVLKEISPEYSLEGQMLKLKLQYFGHLMWRTDSLERTWCWEILKARGKEDERGWDGSMASPSRWMWVWANSGSSDGQGSLLFCSPWDHKELDTIEWMNWGKRHHRLKWWVILVILNKMNGSRN